MALLLLALALLLQTPSAPPRDVSVQSEPRAGKCVLRGRVLDSSTGQPIKGATVRRGWSGASNGSSTDDRGQFRVFGLAAGEYVLVAQRQDRPHTQAGSKGNRLADVTTYYPGTATLAEAQRFSVGHAAEYSDLTFALQALASITVSGRVVVSADRIRHGFGMMMPLGDRPEFMMRPSGSMMLEPDGSFRIHGVTGGSYRLNVQVELANGEREVGHLEIAAGDEDISGVVLSTYGPTTITGRVVVEPASARRPEMMSIGAMAIEDRMSFGGQEDAIVKPDGTFELKVFHSPVTLHQAGPLQGWVQSSVRWKGHEVRGGLQFDLDQPVEGVELVLRRATSRITGTVSGVARASEEDAQGTVIAFGDGVEDPAGIGIVAMVPIRDGRFTLGPMAAGDYQVVAPGPIDLPEARPLAATAQRDSSYSLAASSMPRLGTPF